MSVIVPAFNEAAGLADALHHITNAMQALASVGCTAELIVCDNNSSDDTAAIARAAGARVVFEPVNQIARARNAGAAVASGDWLVFVDADSFPSPELFLDMIREVRGGRCVAGGSTIAFEGATRLTATMARGWNTLSRLTHWAAGSFVFCDAATFRSVGGFCLALYAAEEIDLFRRLKRVARQRGQRVVILHEHPLRTSDRKVRLYSWGEVLRFLVRTVLRGGRTLRSADECFVWYDGRR